MSFEALKLKNDAGKYLKKYNFAIKCKYWWLERIDKI